MELLTTQGDCLLISEHFRDKQWWVCIVCSLYGQEREGCYLSTRTSEGMQENLISWSEWKLQKVLKFLCYETGSQLLTSCRSVANKRPAHSSVCPGAQASLFSSRFKKHCNAGSLTQLPGRLVLDTAFISPNCWSSFTSRLLLLLIIIIVIMWWQRCAEHLWQTSLFIPPAEGRGGAERAVSQAACSAVSLCLTMLCLSRVALAISSEHLAERPDQVRQGQGVAE